MCVHQSNWCLCVFVFTTNSVDVVGDMAALTTGRTWAELKALTSISHLKPPSLPMGPQSQTYCTCNTDTYNVHSHTHIKSTHSALFE